jgi:hypothetical protein
VQRSHLITITDISGEALTTITRMVRVALVLILRRYPTAHTRAHPSTTTTITPCANLLNLENKDRPALHTLRTHLRPHAIL